MTILVLELERPDSLTVEGFWALRNNFFAYTISFFWLYVQKISSKTVWWVMILLFASSLFSYVTAIVSTHFTDSLAQVVYGLVVLFITVSNRGLYRSLYQDDPNNLPLKERIEDMKKWIFFDTVGKVVGLILSAAIFRQPCFFPFF
ncbi:hypothetical protein [Streptococcus cuniculi]|nr:hypothetical protein [Streptococcus cuniculi]